MAQQLNLSFPRFPGDQLDPLPPREPARRPKGKAVRLGMVVYYPDDPDWSDPPPNPAWIFRGRSDEPFSAIRIY